MLSYLRNKNSGFTLAEVLITIGILTAGIVFVLRSFVVSLQAASFGQNITRACFLAEEKIWERKINYNNNINQPDAASQKIENKDFNWKAEISDLGIFDDLKALDFQISWKEKSKTDKYTLSFFTYLPPKQ